MSEAFPGTAEELELLLAPATIRARAGRILDAALAGGTAFAVRPDRLDAVADLVCEVTLAKYPDLQIPYHSRWNHFQAGGRDRNGELDARLTDLDGAARCRAKLDLAVVSVLLDAGAGMGWRYREPGSGLESSRSEGLAVASWNLFMAGRFSSKEDEPLRVDATGLAGLSLDDLREGFQVSGDNPLVGLEGRFQLLRALGEALTRDTKLFGLSDPRPGNLLDHFLSLAAGGEGPGVRAPQILRALQRGLGPIWPGRLALATPLGMVNLGDAWHYAPWGTEPTADSIMPFHKLSQWLAYSLLEPLLEAGLVLSDMDGLTGLAEYRNGGLMLDSGLLELRYPNLAHIPRATGSDMVIEWRALTVALLDRLADPVRSRLGRSAEAFPLARILEGGTWWAGRRLAAEKRPDGGPPFNIQSDGTVF
jgi:hypothetical protein